VPLVESAALQSVVCVGVAGLSGYPAPIVASPFRADRDGLSSTPAPALREKPGSSSRGLRSPSESFRFAPAPARAGAPPMGSRPSSRRQHPESTCDERPALTYVPSSPFRTTSTACSSRCLAGLFHPAAVSRVRASGVSSPEPAVISRRDPMLPRRWRRRPVGVATDAGRRRVDLEALLRSRDPQRAPSCYRRRASVSPRALSLPRALLW
jgi:hypothetical protein